MKFFKYTKEIIYLIISIGIVIKMLITDFSKVTLPDNLTNLISLVLALFSIWLSALFYFKANEASNKFYDNTYQFTKDISEKIGRIEERFGKDLTNIEKGYSRMLDKMDVMSKSEGIQKEIENKTSNEQELLNEKEELIKELIQKANFSDGEKQKVIDMLAVKEAELEKVKSQLYDLNIQLVNSKKEQVLQGAPHTRNIMRYVIQSLASENKLPPTFKEFISHIEQTISKFEDNDIAILMQEGIIDSKKKITTNGKRIINRLFNEAS